MGAVARAMWIVEVLPQLDAGPPGGLVLCGVGHAAIPLRHVVLVCSRRGIRGVPSSPTPRSGLICGVRCFLCPWLGNACLRGRPIQWLSVSSRDCLLGTGPSEELEPRAHTVGSRLACNVLV